MFLGTAIRMPAGTERNHLFLLGRPLLNGAGLGNSRVEMPTRIQADTCRATSGDQYGQAEVCAYVAKSTQTGGKTGLGQDVSVPVRPVCVGLLIGNYSRMDGGTQDGCVSNSEAFFFFPSDLLLYLSYLYLLSKR